MYERNDLIKAVLSVNYPLYLAFALLISIFLIAIDSSDKEECEKKGVVIKTSKHGWECK